MRTRKHMKEPRTKLDKQAADMAVDATKTNLHAIEQS
jgi:hypothetical protein